MKRITNTIFGYERPSLMTGLTPAARELVCIGNSIRKR